MTHYLKRTVTLTQSLDVTPKGLGYNYWLAATSRTDLGWISTAFLNGQVAPDGTVSVLDLRFPGFVIHVHPFIEATAAHAEALGVEVGQAIAGIRWVDGRLRSVPGDTGVSFDKHLARLEAEAEEADRTAAAGEYIVTDRTPPGYGPAEADKPEQGKVYALFTDGTTPSIANGNTWAESEVEEDDNA